MNVLTLSLGRNILKRGSREYVRMQSYATHLPELHIIVLTRKEHEWKEIIHDGNLHIYPTYSGSRPMMLIDAFFLGKKIIQKNTSSDFIISAQDPIEIGWLSLFLAKVTHSKFHVQVHGDYFSSPAWVGASIVRRIQRFFARMLLTRAPAIRVVSKRIANSLIERGISGDVITILPIRPEIESFLQTERTPHKVPPYTFLYLGRFAPEKDIERVIHAFAALQKKYPEIFLHLVGEGSEREKMTALVHTALNDEHQPHRLS